MALTTIPRAIWSRAWLRWPSCLGLLLLLVAALALRPLPGSKWDEAARERTLLNLARALQDARAIPGEPSLRAGAAKRELAGEDEEGTPLGGNPGFGIRRRAEKAAPESVWARALALRQGERRAVMLAADLLVVHPALVDRVLELVQDDLHLTRGELFFVATHTHNGPGGYWRGLLPSISLGRFDEERFQFIARCCAGAIREAFASIAPVRFSYGTIEVPRPVAHRTDARQGVENAALSAVRLEALDDSFVVDLLNYSAHPTALLRGGDQLSGDYPGVLAWLLEDERRTVLFTPGTIGDQRPSNPAGGPKALNIAEELRSVGWDRLRRVPVDRPRLLSFEFEVELPAVQVRVFHTAFTGSWGLRDWCAQEILPEDLSTTTVQVLRLGPVVLLGAPCDLATSVGLPLIRQGRELGLEPIFASMTDDWIGYVFTEDEYYGVDKTTNQFHGPSTGALFGELYAEILQELAARP